MATHPLTSDVHQTVVDFIGEGRQFALATILRSSGSIPREAGTKALIDAKGSIWGTIGGGLLESEAQRLAVESLQTRKPAIFDFKFSGPSATGDDPVCGGTVRVLVDPNAMDCPAFCEAAELVRQRRRGVLLTAIATNETSHVAVRCFSHDAVPRANESPFAAAIHAALSQQRAESFTVKVAEPEHQVEGLAEPIVPQPLLLVAGGGHVGQALAAHARLVGFDVVVVEDRTEFASPELYPPDVITRCGNFADALEEFPITPDTYVAIVGRGHKVDSKALAACIDKPAAYIGMMGSRRKVALVRKAFLESGQATPEQFARVYAPIGLNLAAETVPEIAATIVAQLIAVRRTGQSPRFD
jgi:xanthine dehydrogenase accessory factor